MDVLLHAPPLARSFAPPAAQPRRRNASLPPPCASGERPRLSVVVVNYLHWDDTARLVSQLRDSRSLSHGEAEIVIIDNHSPPHPVIPRLRRMSGVSLRRFRRNRGFARAVNEGCRLSRGDWLLLLNPDTSVPPGFLDDILSSADRLDRRTGVAGFRLHDPDGSDQPSTGRFPDLLGTLTRLVLPRRLRKYSPPPQDDVVCPVDWVTGCCLLVRRDCFTQLEGLDDDFFLYYEDVDLCRRARALGWSVVFDPSAALIHHRPLHARPVPPHLRLITRHALLTYARKHWPCWQQRLLSGIVRLEAKARAWYAWCRRDHTGVGIFTDMSLLARELMEGRREQARARLRRVVREQEQQRELATVDRHSQPQPSRSAGGVPDKPRTLLALGHGSPGSR